MPLLNIVTEKLLSINTLSAVDTVANRIGLPSIATSVAITSAEEAVVTTLPFINTDYALVISMIGGGLFIIEKLIVIYLRI